MKSNSKFHNQSHLFALLVTVCLLFQTGFAAPVLSNAQAAPASAPQANVPNAPFTSCAAVTGIPQAECQALVALYNSTNGAGWTNQTNWLKTNTLCTWYGVTCAAGHVTKLKLNSNNLTGTIPVQMSSLKGLNDLDLSDNQLTGSLPSQLDSLTGLQSLYLSYNQLTGSLPAQLGSLKNLIDLRLNNNQLTGSIPAQLGSLTNLEYLYLNNNQLTESLPAQLGSLKNLARLRLGKNKLGGEIPVSITGFGSLEDLSLSCGLNSTNPAVMAFVENLVPGWQAALCVTTITADAPDPSVPGGTVNVTVMVVGGTTTPTGTVDISGADTNCQITLSGGIGSCDVVFNTPGAKSLTAIYNGDSAYSGSSDTKVHSSGEERTVNGGFNAYTSKSKIPKNWIAAKFAITDGKDVKVKKEGTAAVKIAGAATITKTLTQNLALAGAAGDVFAFSYWVKGSALPKAGACRIQVMLYNGATLAGIRAVKCPSTASFNWKKITLNFAALSAYNKVVIKIVFGKASGTIWFDGVSLMR